ncbi:MAG: sulfatase-like hydrolase/transferase, partial [Acidobacteriota bacterium]
DASATIDRLSQWLRQGHDQSLIFLHFGVPHAPYLLNGDGTQYSLAGSYGMPGWIPKEHRWSPEAPFYTTQAFQRYLLQTMYVDQLLGRLMDSLEDSGLFQASTLVVTADHGVAFTPGEKRRALQFDPAVVGANNAVPLLWKSAGQTTAHRETRNIELIDVLPTLLDELGSGADVSGMDGRPVSQPPREVKRFAGQDYAKDVWPEVLETSRARHRAIRIAESREGSYFVRPAKYADLIGQPIDSATPSEQTVELVNPLVLDELKRVDMASSFRPNLIEGTLAADSTVEVVGIAINGLLADVVEVFVDDTGLRRFLSVFDPATLEPGDNPIDFVAVSPVAPEAAATGEAALQRLRHSGDTFRLIDGVLSNAEGKPLQRDQERLVGAFDGFDHRIPGVLQIHGWLADRTTWTPPQAYLVVYQDQQHQSRPSRPRPDLTSISEGLVHAGFSTAVRLQGEHFQRDNLRMFVIFDGETYAEMKNIEGMQ